MRPIPFTSEPLISWPRDFFSTKFDGLYLIALIGAIVFTTVLCVGLSYAATVSLAGMICPLSAAYERSDARLVVDACGTVYICPPDGASYGATAVLSVPGGCSVDRVFAGGFQ
jgi:hypothetical protein